MRQIKYQTFSRMTHENNLKRIQPSVCQFELTFGCRLHCNYCFTDCYNKPSLLKKELNTKKVKDALNKVYQAGVLWLCLTGGDPLSRADFLEIYAYAKEKGFIVTVFTSGCDISQEIINYFKKSPPFAIEITVNAAGEKLYERISQVKGSFVLAMRAIERIIREGLPLKIKTQVTKDNIGELPKINGFFKKRGLNFTPDYILYPRLNGDVSPCRLRIKPQEVLSFRQGDECGVREERKGNNNPMFSYNGQSDG